MKPKQKKITMWAIFSPYTKTVLAVKYNKNSSISGLETCAKNAKEIIKRFESYGYRAVKGKFVWEEK